MLSGICLCFALYFFHLTYCILSRSPFQRVTSNPTSAPGRHHLRKLWSACIPFNGDGHGFFYSIFSYSFAMNRYFECLIKWACCWSWIFWLILFMSAAYEDVQFHNTTLARFYCQGTVGRHLFWIIFSRSCALLIFFLSVNLLRGCSPSSSLSEAKIKLGLSFCSLRQWKVQNQRTKKIMKK